MREISEKELDRMKKRGGVKVKRKLGTGQKKPEPEAETDAALSGAADVEAPALASIEQLIADNTRMLEKLYEFLTGKSDK